MITNPLAAVANKQCSTMKELQLTILRAALEMAERGELDALMVVITHARDEQGDCGTSACSAKSTERKHLGEHIADSLDMLHAIINMDGRRKGMN